MALGLQPHLLFSFRNKTDKIPVGVVLFTFHAPKRAAISTVTAEAFQAATICSYTAYSADELWEGGVASRCIIIKPPWTSTSLDIDHMACKDIEIEP
jgi:hypothetical protein